MSFLKSRYESIRSGAEIADIGFFLLRIVALAGAIAWLVATSASRETAATFLRISLFFVAYGLLIYALLLYRFERKKEIYRLSLLFDLVFVGLLIVHSGGFASSFFIGFYLLTALHAFYYGYRSGLATAALCAVAYLVAGLRVSVIEPVDFLLRTTFLFLIGLPIGLLSGILRKDKEQIGALNRELVQSIETMRQIQGKLVEAEKLSALGRFTAEVAHEIRNPLTAIGGFAKRLEKRLPGGTRERDDAGIIVAEVARLERILKDTLTFSHETRTRLAYVDMNDAIALAERDFADACREKGISLEIRPDPSLPFCVADREQVRQALANLAMNAIDAMEAGGGLTISTRTACDNGVRSITIDVADTGPGIPADLADRIFEPFYSTKKIGHGTGLGLSICKKIMEEHRGWVQMTTSPGKGSVFSLQFPFLPPEETFKVQCWEVMRCGMEKIEGVEGRCPAYPNFGRICWSVAGTFSETKVQGIAAQKLGDCRKCPFYITIQPTCDPSPSTAGPYEAHRRHLLPGMSA